jgi:uncharacterized membrane protein
MPSVARCDVHLDLPRAVVWEGLRDLTRAPRYVPNLTGVEITTARQEGVGASRRVFQTNGKSLDETVESWDEGEGFTLKLHNGEKPLAPFKAAWFDYRLADAEDGGTIFKPALSYVMPWGMLGRGVDALFIRRFVEGNVRQVAINFKRHYETGEITNPAWRETRAV